MATPRRSARIGSVARSVASQSVTSVVVTQDTPKGPGRPRALPKVKSRQSTAYGASGRIGAAQELSIPQTGFAEAFQTQRGAAIARASEERQSSDVRSSSLPGRSPSRTSDQGASSQLDYESEDLPSQQEEESEDEEEISAETSKSFGMNHEAGMLRGPTPANSTPARNYTATSSIAASSALRPLSSLPDRDRPASDRREPPIKSIGTLFAEKPVRPPVREPAAGATTPRLPLNRPGQETAAGGHTSRIPPTNASGVTPRVPLVRPDQASRLGVSTPRNPTDRPAPAVGASSGYRASGLRPPQPANGGPVASKASPQRAPAPQAEPQSEPQAGAKITLFDGIKGLPWRYIALAALAPLFAFAVLFAAQNLAPPDLSTQFSNGWKSVTSKLPGKPSFAISGDHSALKTRVDDVELSLKDIQQFVHNLGSEVPDYVVVSRSPSGTMNVPKQFWDAVISRIRKEGPSIEWDTFVQNNQEKLNDALGTEAAVLRKDLFKAIDSNFNDIAADFDKKLETHTRILLKDVEKVATKEAKKVAVEHARLRSMALSNLIANVELQHSKANYFSTGLGANIISGITSPTLASNTGPFLRALQRVVSPRNNAPLTALQTWDEPGDCWCAAQSDSGKTQLGIQLGEPMYPTQLTIEHLPRSSAPGEDISSAPQNIELWVQSDEPALVRFAFDGDRCDDGPEGWQCLGKVRYDRSGANHVQTFLLDGEAQEPVSKVMLRVTTNWGADHTCLYRVRLHGKGLKPVPENAAAF